MTTFQRDAKPPNARPALGLLLVGLLLAACDPPGVCAGRELEKAKTAAEEAAAMRRYWEHCRPLTMSAYDASSHRLSFSDPAWMKKVHHIELSGDGPRFRHDVIDGKNVGLLMGE